MLHFYTLWKRQKTSGFLTISRGIEVKDRYKMDLNLLGVHIIFEGIKKWLEKISTFLFFIMLELTA